MHLLIPFILVFTMITGGPTGRRQPPPPAPPIITTITPVDETDSPGLCMAPATAKSTGDVTVSPCP